MRHRSARLVAVSIGLAFSLVVSHGAVRAQGQGQPGARNSAPDNRRFDPHDLAGIWTRNSNGMGGGGTCRDCGDRGFGNNVPAFTEEGQKRFEANKPSYGRALGTPDAAAHPEEHIGRRRAVPPANDTDPYQHCNPQGVPRALLYPDPVEFIVLPNRIVQNFQWTYSWRTIWTDGRTLPKEVDLPRWWGYSAGHWEGDTFVVDTTGLDDRSWVDHFGYPHSDEMHLQERYRRTSYDTLELNMWIEDPVIYKGRWNADVKHFKLLPKDYIKTPDGWTGLLEDLCAPADEVDLFNKRIRDPAGGVVHEK
jgi:hypothetical protein